MTICCPSSSQEVESPPMENSRPEPPARITAAQQQKLREAYSSPMRPSQYTRAPEDAGPAANVPNNQETLREAAARRERERVSMEQVLLDRRWVVHCTSPLFHFQREQLSEYAHDLVKTLRAAALRACGQQFGYSVSIRNTDAFVAFQIREERDRRRSREAKAGPERTGGFVLYFPTEQEQRAPHKGRERQQVLLLRGNEELLRWVCSWLQRRFQCVVNTHVVHIQQMNLKRLARNWVVTSLLAEESRPSRFLAEESRPSRVQHEVNNQEEDGDPRGSSTVDQDPLRAPLLLKYRATKEEDVVRTYTMTVPWATLRRLFQRPGGNRPSAYVPELIELVERLYIDSLPFDLSTYEIERVEMQEVAVDLDGGVELYSMELVHTVLFSLLELLAVQNVATNSRPETTL